MILKEYFSHTSTNEQHCIDYLSSLNKKYNIVKILISTPHNYENNSLKESIKQVFHPNVPAITIIQHPPLLQNGINLELTCVSKTTNPIYKDDCTLLIDNEGSELWLNGLEGVKENAIDSSLCAFEQLTKKLKSVDFTYDSLVRQWNFIGNIVACSTFQDMEQQNYQGLNEIREQFYKTYKTNQDYPAATGIGMSQNGIMIDGLALQPNTSIRIKSPVQIDAHVYNQEVLEGYALEGDQKKAPLFERARLYQNQDFAQLFISGTASIKGQETIDQGDIIKQCYNTIAFIDALSDIENISKQTANFPFQEKRYARIRVYIKSNTCPSLFSQLQAICKTHYKDAALSFVIADVCRDSLLIEIEGDVIYEAPTH